MAKDWVAVAGAINTRLEQLEMTQAELAKRSRVSPATLRQIQHAVPKQYNPRTLSGISEALGWPSGHLEHVAEGKSVGGGDRLAQLEAAVSELSERVAALEHKDR